MTDQSRSDQLTNAAIWDWLLSNPAGRVLPMTTRTIALIALLIAAVVLVLLLT